MENLTHGEAVQALKETYRDLISEKGHIPANLTTADMKTAVKDAFKEMLDEKAQQFGYMTLRYIVVAVGGAVLTWGILHYGIKP